MSSCQDHVTQLISRKTKGWKDKNPTTQTLSPQGVSLDVSTHHKANHSHYIGFAVRCRIFGSYSNFAQNYCKKITKISPYQTFPRSLTRPPIEHPVLPHTHYPKCMTIDPNPSSYHKRSTKRSFVRSQQVMDTKKYKLYKCRMMWGLSQLWLTPSLLLVCTILLKRSSKQSHDNIVYRKPEHVCHRRCSSPTKRTIALVGPIPHLNCQYTSMYKRNRLKLGNPFMKRYMKKHRNMPHLGN